MAQSFIPYVLVSYVALFLIGLIDNAKGPLYPEILTDLNFPLAQGSLVFALTSLASVVSAYIYQRNLHRFHTLAALRFSLWPMFLGCLGMGGFWHFKAKIFFLMSCFVFGLALGLTGTAMNLLIAQYVPRGKQRRYFAGLHAMYGIASFLGPLLLELLFWATDHWPYALMLLSALPVILWLSCFRLEAKLVPTEEQVYKSNLSHLSLLVGAVFASYVGCEMIISTRLVYFTINQYGLDRSYASYYLSLFFFLLLMGRLLSAFYKLPVSDLSSLKIYLSCSFLFTVLGIWLHPLFLAATGLSMSAFYPQLLTLISTRYPSASSAIMANVMVAVGLFMACFHFSFGLIAGEIGMVMALHIPLGLLVFCIFGLVILERKFPEEKRVHKDHVLA